MIRSFFRSPLPISRFSSTPLARFLSHQQTWVETNAQEAKAHQMPDDAPAAPPVSVGGKAVPIVTYDDVYNVFLLLIEMLSNIAVN